MTERLKFRAHARLLTMLGEQLIKNERIALVELVKNSFDADASRVVVDFRGFGPNFEVVPDSSIVVSDNGSGMTEEVVRSVWMNPATPSKAIAKRDAARTPGGRILQGEKGIGRFATFKLGSELALVTRALQDDQETTLLVDISELDESDESPSLDYYLDDIAALVDRGPANVFDGAGPLKSTHGTQIELRGLRAAWTRELVRAAFDDLDRLQPVMWGGPAENSLRADFDVQFHRDGVDLQLGVERTEEFQAVLERAVLRVTAGQYDDVKREFRFSLNGREVVLPLADAEVRGLKRFRSRFLTADGSLLAPTCGPFGFEFFIFDFSNSAPARNALDPQEKDILREHRVYLYRDGIRVYPYGDPQDDWLEVDAIRGTDSARSMFSNDQSVGFVTITQADNPQLRDKTNREGLLESGRATRDFVVLIQTVLSYLRSKPYEQYAAANRRVRERTLKQHRFETHIDALRKDYGLPPKAIGLLDALEVAIDAERELSAMRVARTEQLAGVGLSVETASHDLIASGSEALRLARQVVSELRILDLMQKPVFGIATVLVTRLEFVNARFKDVQGLFVSTRQKQAVLDIGQIVRRVRAMYSGLHADEGITFDIDDSLRLSAKTTEAAILQCVINLVDNATYWVMTSPHLPRAIRVYESGDSGLAITDSGPGVKLQDEPYIFEPFYSGKGDAGKGLGLYIAQQNGLRNGFSVELRKGNDPRELPGATFVVKFGDEESDL